MQHLGDPHLRVVEVDVSRTAHDDGHIDGAVLWNAYRDLKDGEYRPGGCRLRLLRRLAGAKWQPPQSGG
jgi:3-mercaptopyruvate sulfurtransferase SseA